MVEYCEPCPEKRNANFLGLCTEVDTDGLGSRAVLDDNPEGT
jgi:hypothetical protein